MLLKKLANGGSREAMFTEERYAFYLDEPIKTQGRLKATPPDVLEKIITRPEPIRQLIRGNRIQHSKNGVTIREMSLSDQPALSLTINALRAVLFGNLQYLQETFELQYSNNQRRWSLLLSPRSEEVNKQIKLIRVIGEGESIDEFIVTEANGDYSKTRLYETQP